MNSESTMADLNKPPDTPPGSGTRYLSNSIPDQRAANVRTNACFPGGRTFEKIIEEEKTWQKHNWTTCDEEYDRRLKNGTVKAKGHIQKCPTQLTQWRDLKLMP